MGIPDVKVYVLETGCYEQAGISGVYATADAAMAAWSPEPPPPVTTPARRVFDSATGIIAVYEAHPATRRHTYTWSESEWGWTFDADWDDAASITEYEVQG
jgi:hypothetical protein